MEKIKGYIVFVDDDKDEHDLFELAIRQITTCEILHAYDGDEALALIHEHKNNIFAIISDVSMPRISGLELKRIIEQSPLLKIMAIPFAFLTSSTDPVIVKEAYAFGIQGFLEKSGNLSETVKKLEYFIKFWNLTIHPNVFRRNHPIQFSNKI